jgi:hypothetical protein
MISAPLPPIHQAVLDATMLDQLFFDIEHGAEFLGAVTKGARNAFAAAGPGVALTSVADARAALLSGANVGVQLRYRFAEEEWWDTLLCTPAGVRLVRISHTRALLQESAGVEG